MPLIDKIWQVRGSLTLDTRLSSMDAFAKLDDLFQTDGTRYAIDHDTLTFTKHAPRAQDKMAIYRDGTLKLVQDENSTRLLYDLNGRTLMFCFILPFFFLGLAWLLEESRNPAFVFAGIFAVLYVVGRFLEPHLIRTAFAKRLNAPCPTLDTTMSAA